MTARLRAQIHRQREPAQLLEVGWERLSPRGARRIRAQESSGMVELTSQQRVRKARSRSSSLDLVEPRPKIAQARWGSRRTAAVRPLSGSQIEVVELQKS